MIFTARQHSLLC